MRTFEPPSTTQFTAWRSRWNSNEVFALVQPYVSYQIRLTTNLTLTAGLNALFLTLNRNSSSPIEPRLGLSYDLPNRQKLSVAVGLHSQTQPTYTYFYQTPNFASSTYPSPLVENDHMMGLTKSWHYVASYNRLLGQNLRLLLEAYYQHLFNVPVEQGRPSFSMLNTGAAFSRIFSAVND